MRINHYFLTIIIIFLPGCFKQYRNISGTSYADKTVIPNGFIKNKSFAVAGTSNVDGVTQHNELQTKEVTGKISIVLEKSGYKVEQSQDADYVIAFNYGYKSDTKTINVLNYIPGQTQTTTGSVSGIRGYYGQYNETSSTSGSYIYLPQQYTFYYKALEFYVYDGKLCKNITNDKLPPLIWQGTVWNIDGNADLRTCLDFLIVQMFKLFGSSSQGTITVSMYEDDVDVEWLRKAYLQ